MYDEGPIEAWKRSRGRINPVRDAGLIPTWQQGQEQSQPHSVRKLAEDGYESNSLIHSCIKEKATSFASLRPVVKRPNGQTMTAHRVVKLLDDPNPHTDGQDFAELAKTHFEAAGNVYVHKVRVSSNPVRRAEFATFPVQELELIRPDYVKIRPGRTPDDDVFIVTIDGEVKARIPRADMIHIHEPSLTNDFYGLSKIAVLSREGAIDLQMSDFELAFFRNAGVPMGLLKVKGNLEQGEADRIKGSFRKAYNGLKKWFDLLVLNADMAEYTPMGTKQSEMEMDGTRFHVESRVCSVFGVPPLIVGARLALVNPGMTYEDAEHSFWAETMVPDSLRFARAWTKFLLPEFATGADRGAEVTYDFTVVRALQEDRSRKLREVVRMVLTGAFTVNQSLTMVGLPTQEGGDFFVRNGNQVIVLADGTVQPMAPSAQPGPNLDNPLEGAAKLAVEEAERLTIFRR